MGRDRNLLTPMSRLQKGDDMARHRTVAVVQQRTVYGVLHWTSDTSIGKAHRRGVKLRVTNAFKGHLVREYWDESTQNYVSEYNVPCDNISHHELQEQLEAVKDKEEREAKVWHIRFWCRGSKARQTHQGKRQAA